MGQILPNLAQENEALKAKLAAMEAALAAAAKPKAITLKVSEKGAVSIYGMGKWPITLYRSQIERLFNDTTIAQVRAFVKANEDLLTVKS